MTDNPDVPDFLGETTPQPVPPAPSTPRPVVSSAPQAAPAPAASAASRPVPLSTQTPRTTQLDQELIALRQREKDLENRKNQLEEAQRRKNEYHLGKKEMEENFTRGIGILEEEAILARRNIVLIENTLAAFTEMRTKVQRLNNESWSQENYATELTRALTTLENARMEWNSARVKLPILDPGREHVAENASQKKVTSLRDLLQSLDDFSMPEIMKLGLIFHWPSLVLALFVLLIFIAVLLK